MCRKLVLDPRRQTFNSHWPCFEAATSSMFFPWVPDCRQLGSQHATCHRQQGEHANNTYYQTVLADDVWEKRSSLAKFYTNQLCTASKISALHPLGAFLCFCGHFFSLALLLVRDALRQKIEVSHCLNLKRHTS